MDNPTPLIMIYARMTFEGTHRWADAPSAVYYLRGAHRHIFHVKVSVTATHSDREVEFIMLQHDARRVLQEQYPTDDQGVYVLGQSSCEMVAERIAQALRSMGYRVHSVSVSEDNENGAIVIFQEGA